MAFRATCVAQDPLNYFLQQSDEGPYLRVSDVVVRANQNPKEIFSQLIRLGTNSHWSHSALLYLINDPPQGFDNTFLVEAMTTGVRVASWRNEVIPFEQFNVGIRRPRLDWYVEMPGDIAKHNADDPEDVHGIAYLRHVRGLALDQVNGLYDHATIYELSALFAERIARQYLSSIPQVAEAAASVARAFEKWNEAVTAPTSIAQSIYDHFAGIEYAQVHDLTDPVHGNAALRFICSGLVQYSFFDALRIRINNNFKSDAAQSNLSNMHRVIFRNDPDGIIPTYIQQIQSGKLKIADDPPQEVLNFIKAATPSDFNTSTNLEWRYIIRAGVVWKIDEAPADYTPQSADEKAVLALMGPLHH